MSDHDRYQKTQELEEPRRRYPYLPYRMETGAEIGRPIETRDEQKQDIITKLTWIQYTYASEPLLRTLLYNGMMREEEKLHTWGRPYTDEERSLWQKVSADYDNDVISLREEGKISSQEELGTMAEDFMTYHPDNLLNALNLYAESLADSNKPARPEE